MQHKMTHIAEVLVLCCALLAVVCRALPQAPSDSPANGGWVLAPQHFPQHAFFSRWYALSGTAANSGAFGGMAVSDLDGDGQFEVFLGGQYEANRVLKFRGGGVVDIAPQLNLDESDPEFKSKIGLGVSACDVNGDGREEVYFVASSQTPGLRPNTGLRGSKVFTDRLFEYNKIDKRFHNVMTLRNEDTNLSASVVGVCLDLQAKGAYNTIVVGEMGGGIRVLSPSTTLASFATPEGDQKVQMITMPTNYTYAVLPAPIPELSAGDRRDTTHFKSPQSFQSLLIFPNQHKLANENNNNNHHIPLSILAANSMGPNHLITPHVTESKDGSGHVTLTWEDSVATEPLDDPFGLSRATALIDENGDGLLDIIVANSAPTSDFSLDSIPITKPRPPSYPRLFINNGNGTFSDKTPKALQVMGRVRGVIVADFDNDGFEEIFIHNSATTSLPQPNVLLKKIRNSTGVLEWQSVDIGEAADANGHGSGAVALDLDGDGSLELLLTHEHSKPAIPLLFRTTGSRGQSPNNIGGLSSQNNHYLRIKPQTTQGSPARGALVELTEICGKKQLRMIDLGGGSLAQQEPVAHFGLGLRQSVVEVTITFLNGQKHTISNPEIDRVHTITQPRSSTDTLDTSRGAVFQPSSVECERGIFSREQQQALIRARQEQQLQAEQQQRQQHGGDGSAGGTGGVGGVGGVGLDGANSQPIVDCYTGNGETYHGKANTTASGHTCQNWAAVTPNVHTFWPIRYSELEDNLCRNPGGSEDQPWCFTVDGPRWERCGVLSCDVVADRYGHRAAAAAQTAAAAAACKADDACTSYTVKPCPSNDDVHSLQNVCPPGFFFQVVGDVDKTCFCRKGSAVLCSEKDSCQPPTVFSSVTYGSGQGALELCFCVPEPGENDPFALADAAFNNLPPPVRTISLRDAVEFRTCLVTNAIGPLRCIALMESLGYAFETNGRALLGPRGGVETSTGNTTSSSSSSSSEDEDSTSKPRSKVLDKCPPPGQTAGVCPEDLSMRRRIVSGTEECVCLANRFVLEECPDPSREAGVCGTGYVLARDEPESGVCSCLLEKAADEAGEDEEVIGGVWHGGCEHCDYGHGACVYSVDKGWYCRCLNPHYTGDDCLH